MIWRSRPAIDEWAKKRSRGMSYKYLSWGIVCAGVLIRGLYAFYVEPYLHWDEAPQAFMASQIAQGAILPLVLFQLPYIGAVEQYPLALLMRILGASVQTVNTYYFFLSSMSLLGAYWLYGRIFDGYGRALALFFFALCHPFLLLTSLQSYSFGGLILFTTYILWMVLAPDERLTVGRLAVIGASCGLAL